MGQNGPGPLLTPATTIPERGATSTERSQKKRYRRRRRRKRKRKRKRTRKRKRKRKRRKRKEEGGRSSSLMSCPFCGAAECHGSGKQSPPTKLDVTTQLAHQGGWSGRLVDLFLTETAAQVLCWVSCRTARARCVRA